MEHGKLNKRNKKKIDRKNANYDGGKNSFYAKQNFYSICGMKTVTDTHCKSKVCIRTFPYL